MSRKSPYNKSQLDSIGRRYTQELINNVHKCRIGYSGNNWDYPTVAVACGSMKNPYYMRKGHSCETLHNPHPTLFAAYPSTKKGTTPKQFTREGHCAEPHAAHKLLNAMTKCKKPIQVSDILFGKAFSVIDCIPVAYCPTCKKTFPQLK